MKLNSIELDSEEAVETITVTMTVKEAAWIAKVAGSCRDIDCDNDIYSCLTGAFFNRFYEDGVSAVEVRTPDIKYDKERTITDE